MKKCLFICLWIPQTVLDLANTFADSAKSPVFWAILRGTEIKLFACGIQNSEEDQRKRVKLRILQQALFWPVAESTYNAQNAQFRPRNEIDLFSFDRNVIFDCIKHQVCI